MLAQLVAMAVMLISLLRPRREINTFKDIGEEGEIW